MRRVQTVLNRFLRLTLHVHRWAHLEDMYELAGSEPLELLALRLNEQLKITMQSPNSVLFRQLS